MNWSRIISVVTFILVFALSIISFVLSYNALRVVSAGNGMTGWLSVLWPLLIDGPLVVFYIAAVRAALYKERTLTLYAFVGVFTLLTIAFNVYHGQATIAGIIVAAVPPGALFLSFHTLMTMLKSEVFKRTAVDSLDKTRSDLDKAKLELDKLLKRIASSQDKLTDLDEQIKIRESQLVTEPRQNTVIVGINKDTLRNSPDKRRPLIKELLDKKIPLADIVTLFDISEKTLSRDIAAINQNGH